MDGEGKSEEGSCGVTSVRYLAAVPLCEPDMSATMGGGGRGEERAASVQGHLSGLQVLPAVRLHLSLSLSLSLFLSLSHFLSLSLSKLPFLL